MGRPAPVSAIAAGKVVAGETGLTVKVKVAVVPGSMVLDVEPRRGDREVFHHFGRCRGVGGTLVVGVAGVTGGDRAASPWPGCL